MGGEDVRHSTCLINRLATRSLDGRTRYEMLLLRKPNISHLKVFGCVCYTITETPGRKKLDDRTRMLVHLGTEPGSKAYMLLDPDTKRIVVSRDVHFTEEKEWNWNKTDRAEHLGEFEINLRSLGNISDGEESTHEDGSENQHVIGRR